MCPNLVGHQKTYDFIAGTCYKMKYEVPFYAFFYYIYHKKHQRILLNVFEEIVEKVHFSFDFGFQWYD